MKYCVTLGAAGDGRDPRGLGDLAELAEDFGWDGVFLEDYLNYQGQADTATYDAWISLAAMASATSRLHVGMTVSPVPRYMPWDLAAKAVAVDHLSGGRLILGVGAGDVADPTSAAIGEPSDPRTRAELLDEGLAIVTGLWTGEPLHHRGKYYRIDGLRMTATPVQEPRIPIWVGGDLLVAGVRRRLAQWDGACVYKGPPGSGQSVVPDDVRMILDLVIAARGSADGFDVKISGVDDSRQLAEYADAGATWSSTWIPPGTVIEARAVIAAGPPG